MSARFAAALALSLLLHAAGLALAQWRWGHEAFVLPAPPTPLAVRLPPVILLPAAQPPLVLPEPVHPAVRKPTSPGQSRSSPRPVRAPEAQVARQLLYPPEAIAQGLEGEALVLLFLDEAGDAVAARIERGSGHAILDEAALRAARSVRSAPDGTPREVLLPVRFRLR